MSELLAPEHPRGSRIVHLLQSWSAESTATGIAAVVSTAVLLAAVFSDQREQLLLWYGAVAAGVTLVMVFVLQHTQTRQQGAVQLKLDELLRALPGADGQLIKLESAPQREIDRVADAYTGDATTP